ncbi:MAG: XcyI family restriction endonuclease [Muribaculaceae bacterium]|nr:XcyI family restriction endonuclease [Muribaculaceae bacterium]
MNKIIIKKMVRIKNDIVKESYLPRSTFFYNKLQSEGYFGLFLKIREFDQIEGPKLNWDHRVDWGVSETAWEILQRNGISPTLVFIHPKVLKLNPDWLKYYRSVAMIPQKGLKAISSVSNIEKIESGEVESAQMTQQRISSLTAPLNETISLVISLASDITEKKIEGMMYAAAGTKIDGSWRNSIGAEGERVIRTIIFNELCTHGEVSSVSNRNNHLTKIEDWVVNQDIDDVKILHLINGYTVLFASEPDVTIFDSSGAIVGVIEIKSGLDPAGALERLGAMLKSFENTLSEYPDAITILVASCITDELENRLGASMLVRQKFVTTNITSSEKEQRKFVNSLRKVMNLINKKS